MKIPPSGNNRMASRAVALVGIPPTESGSGSKSKTECFQAERDKFLRDFEKPTQIYRFMRARMLQSPIFLLRNLNYMRNRMSRSHKSREGFKVDSIMKIVEERQKEQEKASTLITKRLTKNFLHMIILGFSDGQQWLADTEAKIDVQIVRICLKKRKESHVPITRAFTGSCKIKVRSSCTESIYKDEFTIPISKGKYPVVSVPKDCLTLSNGHVVQSIRLIIRVGIPASGLIIKSEAARQQHNVNGISNSDVEKLSGVQRLNGPSSKLSLAAHSLINSRKIGSNSNSNNSPEGEEPKPKRQRSLPTKDRENFIYESQQKSNGRTSLGNQEIVYVGMISIYDQEAKINIPAEGNSDLEIRLNRQEIKKSPIPSKRVTREGQWALQSDKNNSKITEYLADGITYPAKLAIAIRVSNEKMDNMVDPPAPVTCTIKSIYDKNENKEEEDSVKVVYQFTQGNNGRQTTESYNDLRCPWCSINCIVLYSLLKHLKISHSRFNFSYVPIINGARVDVSINESYDGSYSGSAFDLVAQPPGEAFARNGPAKRTQVFFMIVFRPPPLKRSLQEFLENDEKDAEQRRSYMTGHNRLYHHTTTCLPIHPREIDVDSEGEPDPEWLRVKTCMMIDEFTDVNEGEKEIMKMWNHHVMHDNYVGDCQIPLACLRFVERYGKEIIQKNLYRNFILHLTSLYDFGLLPAQRFHGTVQLLHLQMKENNTASALRDSWRAYSTLNALTNGPMEDMEVDEPDFTIVSVNGKTPNGNCTSISNGIVGTNN